MCIESIKWIESKGLEWRDESMILVIVLLYLVHWLEMVEKFADKHICGDDIVIMNPLQRLESAKKQLETYLN